MEEKDRQIAELSSHIAVQEKLSDLIRRIPMGVYEIDFRGPSFVSVNDYICASLGYTRDELLSMSPFSIIHEDDGQLFRDRIKGQLAGEKLDSRVFYRVRAKDGRIIYSLLNVTFTYEDGRPLGALVIAQDITEQKLVEDSLKESEERFRLFAELAPVVVLIYQDDRFVYINKAAEDVTGYTREEIYKMRPWDVMHSDDQNFIMERVHAREQGKHLPSFYQVRLITKSGEEKWVGQSSATITYGNRPAGIVVAFDLTERKRAEEALKLTQASIDGAAEMVAWFTPDGKVYYVNDAACRTLGYSRDELLKMTVLDISPGFTQEDFKQHCQEVRERKSLTIEIPHRRKDGSEYPAEIQMNYVQYGGQEFLFAYARDITERNRADEAIRASEASLAHAQKIAHLGSWEWDIINNVNKWSEETYCIFGIKQGEFGANYESFIARVHPDDRALVREAAEKAIREQLPFSFDYRIILPDGAIRYLHNENEIVTDTDGKVTKLRGTVQDITDRKRVEEELKDAKLKAELYLDLMGHDINNMHQIAMGYLEIVEGMIPDGDPRRELLEKPTEVLQRSAQLIKNVRKLQKLREGAYRAEDVDACQMLEDIQQEFGSLPGKAITLNMNGCERCHVRANELLHDVFANLVSNAIKHTGDRADINIGLDIVNDNDGRYCRVSVDDNGPGIHNDFKSVIFNRMLNGSNHAKGMGLGLYLVKSLVDSYGGRVWVEDRVPGNHTKGAKFVVMLPAVENH